METNDLTVGDFSQNRRRCPQCNMPIASEVNPRRVYCSIRCRDKAYERRKREKSPDANRRRGRPSRRSLPDTARDAGWAFRRDIERIERIVADDRFAQHEEQVAAQLRSHLAYAAEVCRDLLSRINHQIGE